MLSLDSSRWSELSHAYGCAKDIPDLLRQLHSLPSSADNAEPWFSIWSALAHQGDVFSASFAAVPHVVHALTLAPMRADYSYFQFPVWVEICRSKHEIAIPEDVKIDYFYALSQLPSLVALASSRSATVEFTSCALAAIAIANGQPLIAEAALELNPQVSANFLKWHFDQ